MAGIDFGDTLEVGGVREAASVFNAQGALVKKTGWIFGGNGKATFDPVQKEALQSMVASEGSMWAYLKTISPETAPQMMDVLHHLQGKDSSPEDRKLAEDFLTTEGVIYGLHDRGKVSINDLYTMIEGMTPGAVEKAFSVRGGAAEIAFGERDFAKYRAWADSMRGVAEEKRSAPEVKEP